MWEFTLTMPGDVFASSGNARQRFLGCGDCGGGGGGGARARPHCRSAPPLIRFITDSLTYSVNLFLMRQCDGTLGGAPPGGHPHFIHIPKTGGTTIEDVGCRAANSRGSRRTPSHPVEGPLHPPQTGNVP
jgi:hypothetical protein